jgi:hypothetical protein
VGNSVVGLVVAVLCGARDVVTVCPAFLVLSLRDDEGLGFWMVVP